MKVFRAVLHETTYLETLIEMFRSLTAQVKEGVAEGQTLEAIQEKATLEDFRNSLVADDAMRNLGFRGAFLHPAIERAYQEATTGLKPETAH